MTAVSRRSLLAAGVALAAGGLPAAAAGSGPVLAPDGSFLRLPERAITFAGHAHVHLGMLGVRPVGTAIGKAYTQGTSRYFSPPLFPTPVANADYTPDLEAIARLNPDLIVCWSSEQRPILAPFGEAFVLRAFTTLDEIKASLRHLARNLPVRERLEARIRTYDRRFAAYRARIERPHRLIVMSGRETGRIYFLRNDNAAIDALRTISRPVVPDERISTTWTEGTAEWVHAVDPDAIILLTFDKDPKRTAAGIAAKLPLWRELRAYRDGRVVPIDGLSALHFHALPTLSDLVDAVAPQLYPGLFPAALTPAEVAAAPYHG